MKFSLLFALPAALKCLVVSAAVTVPKSTGDYSEHLHLKPLPGGYLYAGFNFTATTPLADYHSQNFRFFPRSLGQILQNSNTAELHLRFALGRWDDEQWGSRPRQGRREGGTGVEIWAWLEQKDGLKSVDQRWDSLVNSLSGLFCASLNFIDGTKTTRPVLSFVQEGNMEGSFELLHGALPNEVVCTENLTPYMKLLPCKGKAGISSLLDGHKVFDANWQTMSVDVRPICSSNSDCILEIQQTIDMVLDIERSMRPQDNPIPRPPPIEDIECDMSKSYNAEDTCYPKKQEGEIAWSLSRIFGRPIQGNCRFGVEGEELWDISLEVPQGRAADIISASTIKRTTSVDGNVRLCTLAEDSDLDISLPQQSLPSHLSLEHPPLYASRQLTGYGQERGGMHAILRNPHPFSKQVVYLESLPWFLRPYMHTLTVSGATLEKMYYTPSIDRQRGTHLELLLNIPAESTVDLTYDVEKAILRYTEYPPDANRGFDIPSAIIRILPSNNSTSSGLQVQDQQGVYLRTTSLLLALPTPDFSMPYNVIILTSTVIALGFGSIFNLLVRRFVLVEEVPISPLAIKVQMFVAKAKEMIENLGGNVVTKGGGNNKSNKLNSVEQDEREKGRVPDKISEYRKSR
ncbi:hypothetical protein M433DRAFT_149147 [Acidomyces richmondensis BFW]|nr:MAG: hypothetical protein FE78DRAFT_87524 [Acidomyces sp. 'richmondensis']KYG50252.1 hypothetical protein M433DRAFT_149147 [Acidomyces richmondensis BFW]